MSGVEFVPNGPIEVRLVPRWRAVDPDGLDAFWTERPKLAGAVGCYVFAIGHSGGLKPLYVGQTTRSFKNECFSANNQLRLNKALQARPGRLVLFLLAYDKRGPGALNKKAITDLENALIGLAFRRNPDLINKQGVGEPVWRIRGVLRSGVGKPSSAASEFSKTLGL